MSSDFSSPYQLDEIDPYAVRWYYSTTSSVKPVSDAVLDIPGKSDFIRFCDGDSLLLETVYRKHASEYNECWLQQQEAYKRARKDKSPPQVPEPKQAELEPRGPVVRAGYFEADIRARSVYPVYWPGDPRTLMRGTWFVVSSSQGRNLIPLPHLLASKLEKAWQSRVYDCTIWDDHKLQPEGVHAARVDLSDVSEQNYHALFCDRNRIHLCSNDNLAFLKGLWTEQPGALLVRGYSGAADAQALPGKKAEQEDAELSSFESRTVGMAVRHVVFAVHGIGQRMGGRTIVEDAQSVRSRINVMLDDHMHDEIGRGYIQVLPIQWRKNLDLEADRVAERIMPEGARSVRMIAHNTCVEVLMYMSPSHAQNIVDSVANNLNSTYLKFIRRHPEFNGKFSVLAYSLGSVLCYDLLSHQPVKDSSALARGYDNLMARQALASEGGFWGGGPQRDPGRAPADMCAAQGGGDSAAASEERADAAAAAYALLPSPGTEPNSGRSEGPGPAAADSEGQMAVDGQSKSGNSRSSSWAIGHWISNIQAWLPGGIDDCNQSTDEDGAGEGRGRSKGSGYAAVDRVSQLLDAAPGRMLDEGKKEDRSDSYFHEHNTCEALSGCCSRRVGDEGGGSASESGSGTPLAANAGAGSVAGQSTKLGLSSQDGGSSHGAAGEMLAALSESTGGRNRDAAGDGGSGAGKPQKTGYRWRMTLPWMMGSRKKTQSSKVSSVPEEQKQGGTADWHAAESPVAGQAAAGRGNDQSIASEDMHRGHAHAVEGAVCEAQHSLPGDDKESQMGCEHVFAHGASAAERDGGQGTAEDAAPNYRNVAESFPQQWETNEHSHASGECDQQLPAFPPPPSTSASASYLSQCQPRKKADNAGMGSFKQDLVSTVCCSNDICISRPVECDLSGGHVTGHAVEDSCARLAGAHAIVPATQAARVAQSAMQDAVHQTPESTGECHQAVHRLAIFESRSHPVGDTTGQGQVYSSNDCLRDLQPHVCSSRPATVDVTHCGRSCDGSATRLVSQLTRELSASTSGTHLPAPLRHSSFQQLPVPESAAGDARHGQAVCACSAASHAVCSSQKLSSKALQSGAGSARPSVDVQQNQLSVSMSAELRQLQEQQADVSNRIAMLRAALNISTDAAASTCAPQTDSNAATGAVVPGARHSLAMREPQSSDLTLRASLQHSLHDGGRASVTRAEMTAAASLEAKRGHEMDRHHTYGMGELMDDGEDGVGEGAPWQDGEEPPGSPVKSTIELARVLWPGDALHHLDQQEKVPLSTQTLQYPKLFFEVDNFIMLGSPTGLFCALRGINPSQLTPLGSLAAGRLDPAAAPGCLPVCRRFFNVFHPFDPVAYRMEPLVQTEEVPKPQHVPDHKKGKKLHIGMAETRESVARTMSQWQKGVAHAFTLSFKRSKGGDHERSAAVQDLQQCSLIPSILGASIPPLPPDCVPNIPLLDIGGGGSSSRLPGHTQSQPATLLPSMPALQSLDTAHGVSSEAAGTSGSCASERPMSADPVVTSAFPGTPNHSSLPPLAEEVSNAATTSPAPAAGRAGTSSPAGDHSNGCGGSGQSEAAIKIPGSSLLVPERQQSRRVARQKPAPASSEGSSKHELSAPSGPCTLSETFSELQDSPSFTCRGARSAVNSQPSENPNSKLPGSNAASPVSGDTSTSCMRSAACVPQSVQHVSTLRRRSSLPRIQTAPQSSDVPSTHSLMLPTPAPSLAPPLVRSSSLLSLPCAATSAEGASISGFRGGSEVIGKGTGEASARVLKPKPTLARAGQFGPVSIGQGGSVGRLDFQLQTDFAEIQWVGALKAHFCYWKHDDVALLICRAACGYDVVDGRKEEQPVEQEPVSSWT